MKKPIEPVLAEITSAYSDLAPGSDEEASFLAHLRSLISPAKYPEDYPKDMKRPFPDKIAIAYAGCRCGYSEFIVDGSTQECQYCGSIMFRYETAEYKKTI